MNYDFEALYSVVLPAIQAEGTISSRMQAVIEECERQRPHPDWMHFRQVDYDADSERLGNWLQQIRPSSLPPNFQGLWIGLIHLNRDDVIVADAYCSLAPGFQMGSIEWMAGLEAVDEERYLGSSILSSIYRLACDRISSDPGLWRDGRDQHDEAALAIGACRLARGRAWL